MKKFLTLSIALVMAVTVFPASISAQNKSGGQLMFVLDASSSMRDTDGGTVSRLEKAKTALNAAVDSAPGDAQLGLRAYGHRVPDSDKNGSCQDTEVLARPAASSGSSVKSAAAGIQANGYTPIGKSLQEVKNDFSTEGAKTVILLSDGIDTCSPPDPCQVAKDLAASGLKIKINTLGLTVDNAARQQLTCIAQATGGEYIDVSNLDKLKDTLASLTAREANLFSTRGTPIEGKPRIEEAPLLSPNVDYTDDIVGSEELFYAFELKQGQKFKIVIKGDNTGEKFGAFDQLLTDWYRVSDSEQINAGRDPSMFENLSGDGVIPIMIEDEAPGEQTGTEKYAVKLSFRADEKGKTLPLEIKLTTEGGVDPESSNSSDNKDKKDSSSPVVPIVLGVLALLAAAAFGLKKYLDKKGIKLFHRPGSAPTTPIEQKPETPAEDPIDDKKPE